MSLQALLGTIALPPLFLAILALLGAVAALRGSRTGAALAAGASAVILLLATPMAAGWLRASLESSVPPFEAPDRSGAEAIIVLGAEVAHGADSVDIGPLTLERLRAGAALQRRTGLPLLVTGGPLAPGDPPIATLMAHSLTEDFRATVRWVEPRAADTRGNAVESTALLKVEGIGNAYLVTHAWHLPRALEAFDRAGLTVYPVPVLVARRPDGRASDWVPRPDHLAESWYMIREWVGRAVYALRDRKVAS